jgi:hypothetical protein
MTIDLQLAAHKQQTRPTTSPEWNRQLFRKPRILGYSKTRNGLDLITKQLRDSTWRRHESHEKQLKHFLDRDRFQRHATWQGEYDRLASQPTAAMQPFIHDRIEQLKDLLVR